MYADPTTPRESDCLPWQVVALMGALAVAATILAGAAL